MTIDGTFETGASGWTLVACTFAQSTDVDHSGTHSAKMTSTSTTATISARSTTTYPVTAGVLCTLMMWGYSATLAANTSADIDWYDVSGTKLSSSTVPVSIPATTWTLFALQAVAPPNATQARFGPTFHTSTSGQVVYWDDVTFIPCAVGLTANLDYPPQVAIVVMGLAPGNTISLERFIAGDRTPVRGVDGITVIDPNFVAVDSEEPFGTPVRYVLVVDGQDAVTSAPITVTLPGGMVAISDAITGLAVETGITAWPDRSHDRDATQFKVGGRTVVVSAPRSSSTEEVEFLTFTEQGRQSMIELLDNATSNIIQIRQPGGYDGVDGYFSVLSDTESRVAQDGLIARRLWTLSLVGSQPWAAALITQSSNTYAQVTDEYAGLTYADLTGDFDTYLDMTTFDWSGL